MKPQSARKSRSLPLKANILALAGTACIAAALLYVALDLRHTSLRVPLQYSGDALYFLSVAKGISEGNPPWLNHKLAAPFQADWRDFPSYQWIDFAGIRLLSLFTSEAPMSLNLYWLFTVVAASVTAAACLLRLGLNRILAGGLGLIYAFQPFTFARNISHFCLVHYLVPLIALICIEILSPPEEPDRTLSKLGLRQEVQTAIRRIPLFVWITAVLQGLSYVYNSFFGTILIGTAGVLGAVRYRSIRPVVRSGAVIGAIGLAAACGLSPSLYHWAREGRNPAMQYKNLQDAEMYGLKIRHLLTPVPSTPISLLRRTAERIQSANLPGDRFENSTSRLGTFAAASFVALLAYGLLRMMGYRASCDNGRLSACAVLVLACTLLSTVGGFGFIFNAVVAPDFRAYNRIVVFIDFFCVAAAGMWLQHLFRFRLRLVGWPVVMIACAVAGFAVWDELWAKQFFSQRPAVEYLQDRAFVRKVEAALGGSGSVFQLPHSTFPVDNLPGRMQVYEHARAYISSEHLQWSWGSITGRASSDWALRVSHLPLRQMLLELRRRGFRGVWIDTFGYTSSSVLTIVEQFRTFTGREPLKSPDGRCLFFDISNYHPPNFSLVGTSTGRFGTKLPQTLSGRSMRDGLVCSIDRLNGGAPAQMALMSRSQRLNIIGWAADPKAPGTHNYAVIQMASPEHVYYAVAERNDRPDVAAAFSNPELITAGLALDAELGDVVRGKYSVRVIEVGEVGKICNTGVSVSLQ